MWSRSLHRLSRLSAFAPLVQPATCQRSLYRNLLFITSNPPFSVHKIIDYYFDSPKTFHSTKSFNLLISLALRNASFASVNHLFTAMRAQSTPEDIETWKLHVRWLVRTGRWNDAWKLVLHIASKQNPASLSSASPIPLPLWLELFGSQQRGALRHWVITDRIRDTRNDATAPRPLPRKQLLPRPCREPCVVESSRYRALCRVSPLLASSDHVQILPRTVHIITQMMYRIGQRTLALSTALSYLKTLPPQLRRCDRRRVLDLVNSHLSMATRHKAGLKQHFYQRRILRQFLDACPGFTPSASTLFLLLRPLRKCRRSGTLAMHCFQLFDKRWGRHTQSSRVRRRVASLALKEGRLDIVEEMSALDRRCRTSNDALPRIVYTSRRRPWRILFSQRGVENRRWRLVEDKHRRRLMSRSESNAVV